MRNNNVTIIGTGSYLPLKRVTNEELCEIIDTTPSWIEEKLGVKERRMANSISTSRMAYFAALAALDDARVNKEELDLIIVITSSPDQISPSTASVVHRRLNIIKDVPSFDINAVCAGFVYAISIASTLISAGAYKKILIVASEAYSRHTDFDDRHCVFFGDGAGAVVLGESHDGWMVSNISSNGSGTGMTGFHMPLNGPFIQKGREVWEQAIKVLPASIKEVLEEAGIEASEVDLLVPHQPSINILKYVAKELGMSMDKVKTVMHKYGNIAGASIPIALDEAIKLKEIVHGHKIVLSAVGAGWAWGSVLINYDK